MNKLFAKVIAKRTIAFLLIVVLIATSMPAVAHAESPTNKQFYFYFTNVNSDSTKEALINNLYLYYADTGLTIPLIDNYLILNEGPTYTGCYFIHLVFVPISRIVQIKNSHGMVVAEFSGENGANVYHPLTTINLSVDGTIIDTIYGYTNDITAPYDGTEEIL